MRDRVAPSLRSHRFTKGSGDPVEVREEAHRADVLLPEPAAASLELFDLRVREPLVEPRHDLPCTVELGFVDPDAVVAPVDQEVVRKHAVGVDEDRDPAATERFVEPVRKVARAAGTQHVVALDHVVDVLLAGLPGGCLEASARERASEKSALPPKVRFDSGVTLQCTQRGSADTPRGRERRSRDETAEADDGLSSFSPDLELVPEVTREEVLAPARFCKVVWSPARSVERGANDRRRFDRQRLVRVAAEEDDRGLACLGGTLDETPGGRDLPFSLDARPVERENGDVRLFERRELQKTAAHRRVFV